jgi:beta-lactamase class A
LVLRLLVIGVGLGVITGTALKLLAPRLAGVGLPPPKIAPGVDPLSPVVRGPGRSASLGRFEPRLELTGLSQRWAALAGAQKGLKATGFLLVLDDGRYAQLDPDTPLPAASAIKSPILLASLEDLDAGKLRWNEPLILSKEVIGAGSGWMASRPPGTRFPLFEAATEMIRVSDNTATNLLIKRLGGKSVVNGRFTDFGLAATQLRNFLPDLEGTNTTSSRDLARTIALVEIGEKLSPRARDLYREIMGKSTTNTLIPLGILKGLGGPDSAHPEGDLQSWGITVLNKTGDIGIAYADAGLIELPNGQRAVAAFMVKGPFNDPRSTDLIRAMAGAAAKALVSGADATPPKAP